jgi:hypothetical protein
MYRMSSPITLKWIFSAALVSLVVANAQSEEPAANDPHRPACVDAHCRKVRSFLKAHYCGAAPFGNGPDDSCEIKKTKNVRTGIDVTADYNCEWSESTQAMHCEQHGQPSQAVSDILTSELHRIGLPAKANVQTYFTVWKAVRSGWSIAVADYSNTVGSVLEVCEVVAVIDERSHATVLRKLPFQRTDVDVPNVTEWTLVDLADVEGTGQEDIVLEGDEYENHWLEVVSLRDETAKTVFSGLGYYL